MSIFIKIKGWFQNYTSEIFLFLLVFLSALILAGFIYRVKFPVSHPPIIIENPQLQGQNNAATNLKANEIGDYLIVGNKNSKLYFLPTCHSFKLIKEQNRVYFNSENEAKLAGYTLAGNCSIR